MNEFCFHCSVDPDPDTSSSVFDDSDSPSLPQSPGSEADPVTPCRRLQLVHQPLRATRSADPRVQPVIQVESDASKRVSSGRDKQCPTICVERTPSPKPRSPFSYRKPKLKSPRESSSPEVHLRPQHDLRDRPYSEGFSHSLAIPKPNYLRENSSSSISSYLSSPNSPVGSESSVQWASHSPSCSPNPLRRSSSQSRPLNLQAAESRKNVESTVGSAEWQRESWHHWELIAAEKAADTYEQETLVWWGSQYTCIYKKLIHRWVVSNGVNFIYKIIVKGSEIRQGWEELNYFFKMRNCEHRLAVW